MTLHTMNRLTNKQIKNAKSPSRLSDGGGLSLRTNPDYQKSFVFRYSWQQKQDEIGLGGYPRTSLAEARRKAERARSWLAESPPKNPKKEFELERQALDKEEKDRLAGNMTFGEFTTNFIRDRSSTWKPSNGKDQWTKSLTKHAASVWSKPIRDITTEDVLGCLKPIWTSIPPTAERVRDRFEIILNAATVENRRVGPNPATLKGHLEFRLPPTARRPIPHPAIHYENLPDLWNRLHALNTVSSKIIMFAILTGARSGEVRGTTWQELDLKTKTWTLPASRMKNGDSHIVPLSSAALDLLASVPSGIGKCLVFSSPSTLGIMSDRSLNRQLNKLGAKDPFGMNITVHGMRNTFRDFIGEETEFPAELAEFALAHRSTSTVRAYRRATGVEKRRQMMEIWGEYCSGNIDIQHFRQVG